MANYNIITKFIKDVSFEIPNVETLLYVEENINKYNVKVDIVSKILKNDLVQVDTILKIEGSEELKRRIQIEVTLAAVARINEEGMNDKKELKKIILIHVPTEIYPILFEAFSYLIKKSGLPNFVIQENVDFKKLYQSKFA